MRHHPNQLGIDYFDFDDAFSDAREFMCSADLTEFIETHHLAARPARRAA